MKQLRASMCGVLIVMLAFGAPASAFAWMELPPENATANVLYTSGYSVLDKPANFGDSDFFDLDYQVQKLYVRGGSVDAADTSSSFNIYEAKPFGVRWDAEGVAVSSGNRAYANVFWGVEMVLASSDETWESKLGGVYDVSGFTDDAIQVKTGTTTLVDAQLDDTEQWYQNASHPNAGTVMVPHQRPKTKHAGGRAQAARRGVIAAYYEDGYVHYAVAYKVMHETQSGNNVSFASTDSVAPSAGQVSETVIETGTVPTIATVTNAEAVAAGQWRDLEWKPATDSEEEKYVNINTGGGNYEAHIQGVQASFQLVSYNIEEVKPLVDDPQRLVEMVEQSLSYGSFPHSFQRRTFHPSEDSTDTSVPVAPNLAGLPSDVSAWFEDLKLWLTSSSNRMISSFSVLTLFTDLFGGV